MPQTPMRPHRRRGDYVEVDTGSRPESGSPDWNRAVEGFLDDARSRKCSPATIDSYRTYLRSPRIERFLRDHEIRSAADVTPGRLRAFQGELLEAGLSPGSVATFHRIIRNFLGFCRRQGWAVDADTLEVPAPRQASIEPETYSGAEEQRIVEAARTGRDRFLVEFLLRTGLRLSEIAAVSLDDIVDGADGTYLRVRTRAAGAERIVPLDTGAYRFEPRLRSYLRSDRPATAKNRHLFLTTRRDSVTGEYRPLEPQGIKVLLRRIGQDTGIHVHAQKFRDTFATRALAAGVDSLVLQRVMGHATPAMINRYARFRVTDLVDAWRARSD